MTDLLLKVAALVGAEHVIANGETLIVSPANTEEVAAVLGFANQHGLKVRPVGGRTKLSWGGAVEAQIELSLARLNRVLHHPWQDLTCTVQAGCTWQTMQDALARHGQFVALDPLWPEKATVGGVCATNDSGALRHRYGSLRDQVLGMTIVLADGTIARTGGRVVKNVAGYDLPKLMVGSMGTLAVITEVTFRLYSLPLHSRSFTFVSELCFNFDAALQQLRDSQLSIEAMQIRSEPDCCYLDIQLNAHPDARQDEALRSYLSGFREVEAQDVWREREIVMTLPDGVWMKQRVLPRGITEVAQEAKALGGRCVAQSYGNCFAWVPSPGYGGGVIKEIDKDLLPLHQAIKQQFDEKGTLPLMGSV